MCSRSLVLGNPGTPRVSRLTRILAAAALCGLASVSYAQTQTEPNTFAITPFFGWMAGGGFEEPGTNAERDVDEDLGFGIFLNLMADVPERQYELFYAQQNSTIEGTVPVDVDVQYLQIGGTVAYPQSEHVIPYFGLTIGGTRLSPDAPGLDDETKLSFSVGGGVRFPITRHFGIRLDVRAFITLLDDDGDLFCVSEPPSGTCTIKPKSDTFVQYMGSLGVSFGF
jgi:opacity protein-like surface antigen